MKSVKCKVRIRASLGLGNLVVGIRVNLTIPKTLTVIQQVRWGPVLKNSQNKTLAALYDTIVLRSRLP